MAKPGNTAGLIELGCLACFAKASVKALITLADTPINDTATPRDELCTILAFRRKLFRTKLPGSLSLMVRAASGGNTDCVAMNAPPRLISSNVAGTASFL